MPYGNVQKSYASKIHIFILAVIHYLLILPWTFIRENDNRSDVVLEIHDITLNVDQSTQILDTVLRTGRQIWTSI